MITSRSDEIVASLAPLGVLPDWLAAAMRPERVANELRTHVPEFASGSHRLLGCEPQRLRSKGDAWLARYQVAYQPKGDVEPTAVTLVGTLSAPGMPRRGSGDRCTVGFGEPGWSGSLPNLGLHLEVQPRDDALPALPTIVEPDAAAALVTAVLADAGYGRVDVTRCVPNVVRYKPGSRCTVVVDLEYAASVGRPSAPSPIVLKTHQGDKGRVAWEAMTALWDRQAAWRGIVELAQPLAYISHSRILVQGPIREEMTLKELAREAIATRRADLLARLRLELERTAAALASIHRSGSRYGGTASLEGELSEIDEVVDRIANTCPEITSAAAPLSAALRSVAALEPTDPIVPAHHDFRPAQVLLDQGRIGFIDFDGACMAEPALDLGRFRAKLRDIGMSTVAFDGADRRDLTAQTLQLLDELCEDFVEAYQRHLPVSRTRVLLWETADLLTALLHAWTKVRLARVAPRLAVLVHQVRTADLFA